MTRSGATDRAIDSGAGREQPLAVRATPRARLTRQDEHDPQDSFILLTLLLLIPVAGKHRLPDWYVQIIRNELRRSVHAHDVDSAIVVAS